MVAQLLLAGAHTVTVTNAELMDPAGPESTMMAVTLGPLGVLLPVVEVALAPLPPPPQPLAISIIANAGTAAKPDE
jgi:hypothetical protein